jgi:hypothetical protein
VSALLGDRHGLALTLLDGGPRCELAKAATRRLRSRSRRPTNQAGKISRLT